MPDRGLAGRFVEGLLRSRRLVADVPLLVRRHLVNIPF